MYIPPPYLPPPPSSPSTLERVKEIADKPPLFRGTGMAYVEEMLKDSGIEESVIQTIRQLGFEALFSQDITIAKQLVTKIVAMSLAASNNNAGISNSQAAVPPSQLFSLDDSSPNQGRISESSAGGEDQIDVMKYITQPDCSPKERASMDIASQSCKSTSPVEHARSRPPTPTSFDLNPSNNRDRVAMDHSDDRLSDTPPSSGEGYIRKPRKYSVRDSSKNPRSSKGKERLVNESNLASRLSLFRRKRQEKARRLNQKDEDRREDKGREPSSTEAEDDSNRSHSTDDDSSTISGDTQTPNAGTTTITHHRLRRELSLVRAAFFAEVEKSWNQVIRLYLDSNSVQVSRPKRNLKIKQSRRGVSYNHKMTDSRSAVRIHLRALMFPGVKHDPLDPRANNIPWRKLGLWLYFKKKRFVNWNSKIHFPTLGQMFNRLKASLLQTMLKIDLVDWNEDEKRDLKPETPLVVDRKGRVILKVEDLPEMYPNKVVAVGCTPAKSRTILDRSPDDADSGTESTSDTENSPARHLRTKRKRQSSSEETFVPGKKSAGRKSDYESEEEERERPRKLRKLRKLAQKKV